MSASLVDRPPVPPKALRRPATSDPSVESLLEQHLGDVTAYVRRNLDPSLRAKESVSDVVQSVCREVLDRASELSFDDDVAFRAYLYRSALRKVIDRRRYYLAGKRDVAREVSLQTGHGDHPLGPEEQTEALDRFEAAFARLPAHHQEIVSLQVATERPRKQWMFIPAIALILGVAWLQRDRRNRAATA